MGLQQDLAALESELAADISKLVGKFEKKAEELIPTGTPVEFTTVATDEEFKTGGSYVVTKVSRTAGAPLLLESNGWFRVFVPIQGRSYAAYSVKFLVDDNEQELFNAGV